ncbi:FeoA family protein [Chroococcidiopsis sp.]|uniref:FeoA family protein n=1 Tax=Chroococcidiopsis sp. TaxID=3088168 RepID=UPI003F2DCEF7
MFTDFTIFGSSLSLLQPGEQGVVNRVESADGATVQKLRAMGIVPGVTIILQQRSPAYTIAVGGDRLILNQKSADAIYVRLTARSISAPIQAVGTTRFLTALFRRLRKNTRRIEFAATQSKSAGAD